MDVLKAHWVQGLPPPPVLTALEARVWHPQWGGSPSHTFPTAQRESRSFQLPHCLVLRGKGGSSVSATVGDPLQGWLGRWGVGV